MRLNRVISKSLILSLFISNLSGIAFANGEIPNRYETLEGEEIVINNSTTGELKEIEIFGDTIQDPDNLGKTQSVGDLYVDKDGNPILDKQGRKQYVVKIVSRNDRVNELNSELTPVTDGLITWLDAEDGSQGDTILKDRVGNNDFVLKNFLHDGTDGFIDGGLKMNGYEWTHNKNAVHALNKFVRPCKSFILTVKKTKNISPWYIFDGRDLGGEGSSNNHSYNGLPGSSYAADKTRINGVLSNDTRNIEIGEKVSIYFELKEAESFTMSIMCRFTSNEAMDGYFYSLTAYDRALTEDEIIHNYKVESNRNSSVKTILLPVQLERSGDVRDRFYWDSNKNRYVVEKNMVQDMTNSKLYLKKDSATRIIETNITSKLNIPTYRDKTYISTISNSGANAYLKVVVDRLLSISEELIEEAELNPTVEKITLARMYVNNLEESLLKDRLQERLNNIFSEDITLERKTVTSNVDLYVKSENALSLSLSTNNVTFDGYSGVEDMEIVNAVKLTVNSSLPYKICTYLVDKIQNNDKSNIMDKSILNIKANSEQSYNTFNDTVNNPIILLDNQNSGNGILHGIDLKLASNLAQKADVYKTVIKFEVEQK